MKAGEKTKAREFNDGPPPSEAFMVVVWDALLAYSHKTNDPVARHWAHYVSSHDISYAILEDESQLQQYVAAAMSAYKPPFSDTSICYVVFEKLAEWIPGFKNTWMSDDEDEESK